MEKKMFTLKKATKKSSKKNFGKKLKKVLNNGYVQAALTGFLSGACCALGEELIRKVSENRQMPAVEKKTIEIEEPIDSKVEVKDEDKLIYEYCIHPRKGDERGYVVFKTTRHLSIDALRNFDKVSQAAALETLKRLPITYLYVG